MSIVTLSVANRILDKAASVGLSVTPMQLQKLLYFVNGWHLEIHSGKPLIPDQFQAWQWGPVVPTVYREFKEFGSLPITKRSTNPFEDGAPWQTPLSESQDQLIGEIIRIYGSLSGPRMSHLTHKVDTPWSQVWNGGVGRGDEISNDLILAEFQKIRSDRAA